MGIVLTFSPPEPSPEPPADPCATLEAAARSFLAVEAALKPWSDSTLIACLASADPWDREALLAELEARRAGQPGPGAAAVAEGGARSGAGGVDE